MKIGKQGGKHIKLKRSTTVTQKFTMIARIIILILLLIWVAWSQNNMIFVKDYIYTSQRVPKTFTDFTIVNVSDIHNSGNNVTRAVKSCKPDIIVVSGGYADSRGGYNNSIKTLEKLSKLAPTYYVFGDGDDEYKEEITNTIGDGPILIEDMAITIASPELDETAFINKYIGKRLVGKADKGDTDAKEYIEYTLNELENDTNSTMVISGLAYGEDESKLLDKIYGIIGTDKSIFQVSVANQVSLYDTISKADIDILFSGETHGHKDILEDYSKGVYAESGTTMFLSGGVGNNEKYPSRTFNYPEITSVKLSDGTIKNENPLEKLLGYFIADVKTKFDNDEGFKTYRYKYTNGYEQE